MQIQAGGDITTFLWTNQMNGRHRLNSTNEIIKFFQITLLLF